MGSTPIYIRQELHPLLSVQLSDSQLAVTLAEAYARLRETLEGAPGAWAGWKLGGTNHASKAAFGVDELYYGALHHSEILSLPEMAPGYALAELKGEVEIALRISADGQGYDAWCVALELPASSIGNLLEAGVRALVADRCAAGALLLGPVTEAPLGSLSDIRFSMLVDGTEVAAGGQEALIANPAKLLTDFLALARRNGDDPQPGHWVATGGITACKEFPCNAQVEVRMDDTAVLRFRATTGMSNA